MTTCEKHNIQMECMGGRSAHISNWYCPECDKQDEAFEIWWNSTHQTIGKVAAKAAWDHQQKRIDDFVKLK